MEFAVLKILQKTWFRIEHPVFSDKERTHIYIYEFYIYIFFSWHMKEKHLNKQPIREKETSTKCSPNASLLKYKSCGIGNLEMDTFGG